MTRHLTAPWGNHHSEGDLWPGEAEREEGKLEQGRNLTFGVDEPKEAVDIRRAKKHGSHQGREFWRNRQKTGNDREDIEIRNNKLIKKNPDGHNLGLNKSYHVGVIETEGKWCRLPQLNENLHLIQTHVEEYGKHLLHFGTLQPKSE